MYRSRRALLWGVAIALGGITLGPAQQVTEILRGAAVNVASDIFGCRRGNKPCDLSYRIYARDVPGEINGPANPIDGIPRYNSTSLHYVTDAQTTANYPEAGNLGFGQDWILLWDGVTDPGTSDHAGWYGALSQLVEFSEFGNPFSYTCLPAREQSACFAALDERAVFNDTVRADGSTLAHNGGLSPIPCPQLAENGVDALTWTWELPANFIVRDGADSPITDYDLYLFPDPQTPPTANGLAAAAVTVASVPAGTTSVSVDRSVLATLPGLSGATTYSAALKLRYGGGLESQAFSCNSVATGQLSDPAGEASDAPFAVDLSQVAFEARCDSGRSVLIITLLMSDTEVAKNLIHYEVYLGNGPDQPRGRLQAFGLPASASRRKAGADVLMRFGANGKFGDVAGLSSLDRVSGRVQFVVDGDALAERLQRRHATLSGRVRLRAARDSWSAGEVDWPVCP